MCTCREFSPYICDVLHVISSVSHLLSSSHHSQSKSDASLMSEHTLQLVALIQSTQGIEYNKTRVHMYTVKQNLKHLPNSIIQSNTTQLNDN